MTRVYQLGIGGKQLALSSCLLRGGGAELVDFSYSFWLVEHGAGLMLVDCGFHEPAAHRKSIGFERTAIEALALLDIGPADIDAIVLTHLHFDHAGSLRDFPAARLYVQGADLDYFSGPLMRFPLCASGLDQDDLAAVQAADREGRLILLEGDSEVVPGVRTHHVGGHTPGSQLVSITDGDRRVLLTADAAHLYANLAEGVPFPVLHDLPACCLAFERIAAMSDAATAVVPGHDARVRQMFDEVPSTGGAVLALL
ncbi:MAG: hypothetical protein QOE97_3341 [Pseudonocardiales bacterium]|nr:hypothetical protein [Pseudonocardiales bacterium]